MYAAVNQMQRQLSSLLRHKRLLRVQPLNSNLYNLKSTFVQFLDDALSFAISGLGLASTSTV